MWRLLCQCDIGLPFYIFEFGRWSKAGENTFVLDGYKKKCLIEIVKYFTCHRKRHQILLCNKFPMNITRVFPRVRNRTVRRVHVMPWATPIRRIGCLQSYHRGSEDDEPPGKRRC
jgi:hypothetical protein